MNPDWQLTRLSRRDLLRYAGAGAGALWASALVASCGRSGPSASPQRGPHSFQALVVGATSLSLIQAQSALGVGKDLFTFGLATSGGELLTGGSPQVWAAADETSTPLGPFRATWYRFTGFDETHDRSPRSPLPGFYAAEVRLPSPGNWLLAAAIESGPDRDVGVGAMEAVSGGVAGVGTKATAVRTPVATTEAALRKICSRQPPDNMHYVSLDRALASGKPTVVVFSTPLLCDSKMCGPVTDEVLLVFRSIGPARANFVHVDIYPPPHRQEVDPSRPYVAWRFTTDPWTIVVDGRGIIRSRFEGPVVASEISRDLLPLLP